MSEHKRNFTTFFVRVAPATKFQLLRRVEFTNVAAFYSQLLGIWDLSDSKVAEVTVTFTWKSEMDKTRTMVLNKREEDCLSYLIEQIEESPCWQRDSGKCELDVEILLK